MRPSVQWIIVATTLLGPCRVGQADTTLAVPADSVDPGRRAIDAAVQKVLPALVRVNVVSVDYSNGREVKQRGAGSGTIISSDGYVVTNHHVAGHPHRLTCTLSNREEVDATLVGTDPLADIAVLKLDRKKQGADKPFPYAAFGDSDKVQLGDRVLAMGSPGSVSQSVTCGIVSNVELMLPKSFLGPFAGLKMDGEDVSSIVKWIGFDARIFGGNSGGPLVNLHGEVVGVNEVSLGSLGGAIPGNLARRIADAIIKDGTVKRSWLGLTLQPLLKSSKVDQGVLVADVAPGSPAKQAGLKAGDVLLEYDGQTIPKTVYDEQLTTVNQILLQTPVGKEVKLKYQRDGQEADTSLKTVLRGPAHGQEAAVPSLGITVRELSLLEGLSLQRKANSGLLVTGIRPGWGAADAKPALQERDIIVSVNDKPVHTIKDIQVLTKSSDDNSEEGNRALIRVERDKESFLTVVRLGEREVRDRSTETRRAWLPVKVQAVNGELADALNLSNRTGVRVTQVLAGSDNKQPTKLRVGDIIVALQGNAVDVSRSDNVEKIFSSLVRRHHPGERIRLDVIRDGNELSLEEELARSPRPVQEYPEYRDTRFEFQARVLTADEQTKQKAGEEGTQGVLVTSVENGGLASLANLLAGDVIVTVNGQPVATVDKLKEQMDQAAKAKSPTLVFLVHRNKSTLYVELEPDWATH